MKKFITFIAMQPEKQLLRMKYQPQDNDQLKSEREVYFPISVLVESFAEKGDNINLIALMEEDNPDVERNMTLLRDELEEIALTVGFRYEVTQIPVSKAEHAKEHLTTFTKLIAQIDDGDEVYACCTYGTKPIPILEVMALNFAYRVKDNVSVKSIVYGKVNRKDGKVVGADIYDISGLFFMTQIINQLADLKVEHPDKVIGNMLDLED